MAYAREDGLSVEGYVAKDRAVDSASSFYAARGDALQKAEARAQCEIKAGRGFGTLPPEVVSDRAPPLVRVGDADNEVKGLEQRLLKLADKLVGYGQKEGETYERYQIEPGLLNEVGTHAIRTMDRVKRMHKMLTAIERVVQP
jgi:hypothetical protein